jgi:hypothetical protein
LINGSETLELDPVVASALIAFGGAVLSVGIGIWGYIYQKNVERENAELVVKRRKYNEWLEILTEGLHIVKTKKESTTEKFKEKMDIANNMLLLYGSDDVVKALQESVDMAINGKPAGFQRIVLAMRKDLLRTTNLKETDMQLLRAT